MKWQRAKRYTHWKLIRDGYPDQHMMGWVVMVSDLSGMWDGWRGNALLPAMTAREAAIAVLTHPREQRQP